MSCGCIYIEDGDGLMASLYHARTHQARKPHVCTECRGPIHPGELYEYVAANWDDDFQVMKTCYVCLAVRRAFFCGSFNHGAIWLDMNYHIIDLDGELDSDCLADLPKVARDKVCDLIQDYWEGTE